MKKHSIIYIAGLALSLVLIGLYFIDTSNGLCILSCSIGASLIGAVALAFFLEMADIHKNRKEISAFRKEKLKVIEGTLTRVIEIIIRKFCRIHLDELNKEKIYAFRYDDVKEILIQDFCRYAELCAEKGTGNQQITNFYKDGFGSIDFIIGNVKTIISQEDLYIINKIFTKEEIQIFHSAILPTSIEELDSLEPVIFDVTSVIDFLLVIPELSKLKNYYGVYSVENNAMALYDKNNNSVKRPLDVEFDFNQSIKNASELIGTFMRKGNDL